MKIFTIGFTKTTAENFFERLKRAEVRKIVDVRLNNISQLSGFAKRDDLAYFARTICEIKYQHLPILAPTKEILDAYRVKRESWDDYEKRFLNLISSREIEKLNPVELDGSCLLCSEHGHRYCHRRLVAEYLKGRWENVDIVHL